MIANPFFDTTGWGRSLSPAEKYGWGRSEFILRGTEGPPALDLRGEP